MIDDADTKIVKTIILWIGISIGILFFWFVVISPWYNIFAREMSGKAELAEAEWTKKVAIEEAKARAESATLDANAEVERAKGVAAANEIIGTSLKGNDEYLRYLWITHVEGGQNRQVIYVPTEAGLPILEAQRLNDTRQQEGDK